MDKILNCSVCGITSNEKDIFWCGKVNNYLCAKHKRQLYRFGKTIDSVSKTTKDKNEYIVENDKTYIVLRNNKQEITAKCLIDTSDMDKCKKHKWYFSNGYAKTRINNKNIFLHRFILDYTGENVVDHINRNKLDNRKQNLRIVPACVNCANNEYEGVIKIHKK